MRSLTLTWSGFQSNQEAIFGQQSKRCIFVFERNHGLLRFLESEIQHQKVEDRLHLHNGKPRSNTTAWSDTKRHVSVGIDFLAVFWTEPFGVEFFRLRKIFRIVMETVNRNLDAETFFNAQSLSIKLQIVVLGASSFCNLQEMVKGFLKLAES